MALRIFGFREAKHFCSSYGGTVGISQDSLEEYQRLNLGNRRIDIREGSAVFEGFRDCLMREVERCLFMSASHYRRVLDMMLPSASHWAYVTLYYGSWYAAHGILAMFGCSKFKKTIVDVERGTPGTQILRQRRFGKKAGQYKSAGNGSHQVFWNAFYEAVRPLPPLIPSNLAIALRPVQNDPVWQIKNRNDINYDTHRGLQLALRFSQSFSKGNFPMSLPGILGTQFGILERLLEISFLFADRLEIATDAMRHLTSDYALRDAVRSLVYSDKPPALIRKTKKSKII